MHKYSTLMYRAPEMVDLYRNQEVGVKVDVWSLGCILYALCFREHPFADESSLQILNAGFTIPTDSPYLPRMHKLIAALHGSSSKGHMDLRRAVWGSRWLVGGVPVFLRALRASAARFTWAAAPMTVPGMPTPVIGASTDSGAK